MATSSENSSFGAEIAAEILPCRHIVSENVKQGLPPTHLDVICPGHRDILMSVDPHDAGFNDRERALRPHSPSAPSGSMCGNYPRLALERALGNARRPDEVGRHRREARRLEFPRFVIVAHGGLVARDGIAPGCSSETVDLFPQAGLSEVDNAFPLAHSVLAPLAAGRHPENDS